MKGELRGAKCEPDTAMGFAGGAQTRNCRRLAD